MTAPEPPAGDRTLRLLIVGAGAIGTYLGVSLADSGNRVVFLERPAPAEELAERGLELQRSDRTLNIAAPAVASSTGAALEMGPFDAAILAVKSYATGPFLDSIKPAADRFPTVVCLQNGVGNEERLTKLLGPERVMAGTVTSAIQRSSIGQVQVARERGVGVSSRHPLSRRLAGALMEAGIRTRLYPDWRSMKWSKLLTNLLANAISAIVGLTPGEIFSHPRLYRLELAQFREALGVMEALGLRTVNLPGVPVRMLALSIRRLPAALSRPLLARAVAGGRGDKMPSLYLDLARGQKQSEVAVLNGAVVEHGDRLGVPVPVNRFYDRTLRSLAVGTLPRDLYAGQPERLIAALKAGPTP